MPCGTPVGKGGGLGFQLLALPLTSLDSLPLSEPQSSHL